MKVVELTIFMSLVIYKYLLRLNSFVLSLIYLSNLKENIIIMLIALTV